MPKLEKEFASDLRVALFQHAKTTKNNKFTSDWSDELDFVRYPAKRPSVTPFVFKKFFLGSII